MVFFHTRAVTFLGRGHTVPRLQGPHSQASMMAGSRREEACRERQVKLRTGDVQLSISIID